jgi:hypothetical protein
MEKKNIYKKVSNIRCTIDKVNIKTGKIKSDDKNESTIN